MKYLYLYLILINAAGFLIMLVDKHKAIRGKFRIPEKTIWITAAMGGSLGCTVGMRIFRHKTQKGAFPWGLPLLLLFHASLVLWLLCK